MVLLYIASEWEIIKTNYGIPVFVGPSHHGMTRPQVADGGTPSDMEGSCEYIE